MDSTGYSQAVIHFAWFRDDHVRHLLFGMVELRPSEFPDALGSPEYTHRATSKGRKYLYYRRFVMRAKDATEWYKSAADGSPITLPGDPKHPTPGDGAPLSAGRFGQEPRWPETITSDDLVFAPGWMTPARVHFLVPQEPFPANVSEILRVQRNRERLEDWLNFDIVDAFNEYQGVLCIVAPNPIFRAIDRSHLGSSDTDSAETVAYKIVGRQGQTPSGLCLTATNERVHGPLTPIVHKFNHNPITKCRFPTRIYKEGISVTHSDYGLLHWRRPAPLVRSIRVTANFTGTRKVVQVPTIGGRPGDRYEVHEVGDESKSVIGKPSNDPIYRFAEAEGRHTRFQLTKNYDQQWFCQTPREAAQYVRERIGSAHKTVFIIDPYFAGRELMAFGHAIRRRGVHLRILSSTKGLKKSNLGERAVEAGALLQEICSSTFSGLNKPEIRILGGSPAVHDRFLVIDESVWFSGNSLNSIGERAGMIVKLPDPEPVVERLESFWLQARPLSEWLADRADQGLLPVHEEHAV